MLLVNSLIILKKNLKNLLLLLRLKNPWLIFLIKGKIWALKPLRPKLLRKLKKFLLIYKKIKTEQTTNSTSIAVLFPKKGKEIISTEDLDFESSSSSLTDFEKLKSFDKFSLDKPEIKRFVGKSIPMKFTKNWYSKPTPPDVQFEERFFQT